MWLSIRQCGGKAIDREALGAYRKRMLQGDPRLRRGERTVLYDRDSRFGGPVEGVSGIGGMERGHGGIGARGPSA